MVSMRSLFAYFWRDEPRVIAFVACCCAVLLLAYWKRDALAVQFKNRLVLPALALLLVFGNPASAHILVTRAVETQSLRFFWLIPVSFLLAATVVAVIGRLPRRWLRAAAALAAVPVLVLCTHQLKTLRTNWQYATPNWQKTPQVVLDLCDAIMADDRYDDKRAAFTFPLDLWVRQYQPDIFLLFSWTGGENLDLRREMDPGDGRLVDLDAVGELAADDDCYYLVLPQDGNYTGSLEAHGYAVLCAVEGTPPGTGTDYGKTYLLYRLEEGAADADVH